MGLRRQGVVCNEASLETDGLAGAVFVEWQSSALEGLDALSPAQLRDMCSKLVQRWNGSADALTQSLASFAAAVASQPLTGQTLARLQSLMVQQSHRRRHRLPRRAPPVCPLVGPSDAFTAAADPAFHGPTVCVVSDHVHLEDQVWPFVVGTHTYCTRVRVIGAHPSWLLDGRPHGSLSRCLVYWPERRCFVESDLAPAAGRSVAPAGIVQPDYFILLIGNDALNVETTKRCPVILNHVGGCVETSSPWSVLKSRWCAPARHRARQCHVDLLQEKGPCPARRADNGYGVAVVQSLRFDVMAGVVCGVARLDCPRRRVDMAASPCVCHWPWPSVARHQHRRLLTRSVWLRMLAGLAGVIRAIPHYPIACLDTDLVIETRECADPCWMLYIRNLTVRPHTLSCSQSPWPSTAASGDGSAPVELLSPTELLRGFDVESAPDTGGNDGSAGHGVLSTPPHVPMYHGLCALLGCADPAVEKHGLPLHCPRTWLARIHDAQTHLAAGQVFRSPDAAVGSAQAMTAVQLDSTLLLALQARYGTDVQVIGDRLAALAELIQGALSNGFTLDDPICVVASPGRHRVFMGHTDFGGLGGPTVNANTREELLLVAQWHWSSTSGQTAMSSAPQEDADYVAVPTSGANNNYADADDDDDWHAAWITRSLLRAPVSVPSNPATGSQAGAALTDDPAGQTPGHGWILLSNAESELHPPHRFSFDSLLAVCDNDDAWGRANWPTDQWDSYVRGTLAYLASLKRSPVAQQLRAAMQTDPASPLVAKSGGARLLRLHVARPGLLRLPSSGGVSSSSSLTGAVALVVRRLLHLTGLPLHEIAEVDQGEWLLGKFAGSADKTAQLYARAGRVVVVGSHPVRFLGDVSFPRSLTVLMAECPVPRLTTADGLRHLQTMVGEQGFKFPGRGGGGGNGGDGDKWIGAVRAWAQETMQRNSSHAFVLAVRLLRKALTDSTCWSRCMSDEERRMLLAALDHGASVSSSDARAGGLLRELCTDQGYLHHQLLADATTNSAPPPNQDGWQTDHQAVAAAEQPNVAKRRRLGGLASGSAGGQSPGGVWSYDDALSSLPDPMLASDPALRLHLRRWRLVYRALSLLPEVHVEPQKNISEAPRRYTVRKAALYGLAECERGDFYCRALDCACAAETRGDQTTAALARSLILRLVRRAHDGDRAVVDYRRLRQGTASASGAADDAPAGVTAWSVDSNSGASDVHLRDLYRRGAPLFDVPGGFERSLPEIDEAADELRALFPGQAELRVSAAGLGGAVAVYCERGVENEVRSWLQKTKNYRVSDVSPGPPTAPLIF